MNKYIDSSMALSWVYRLTEVEAHLKLCVNLIKVIFLILVAINHFYHTATLLKLLQTWLRTYYCNCSEWINLFSNIVSAASFNTSRACWCCTYKTAFDKMSRESMYSNVMTVSGFPTLIVINFSISDLWFAQQFPNS